MNGLYHFLILSIVWPYVWASMIIKTSACNGQNGTCSPSWCSPVSNAACVDSTADLTDFQSPMNSLGCKVCTQSTQTKCTSSYLNSVLKTGGGLLAVYCNDDYLVVYSSGEAVHADGLKYIPRPPGETGVAYASACVTRSYHTAAAFYKIPLNPVMLPTANATNNLYLFEGQNDPGNIVNMGLPESGPASVSVSGQSIFPLYNNIGTIAHVDCEMDLCSAHAGQGFDYHYHGDPYHPVAGTCMYSLDDYGDDSDHPPLIGWGLDGFEIYGRHISESNLGYGYDLDVCGGHEHNDTDGVTPMTYHYHSQVLNKTSSSGLSYTTYIAGVNNCWRGNISEVKFFNNSVSFESRPDFDLLKPCCESTEYYTASTVSLVIPTSKPTTMSPTVRPSKSPTAKPSTLGPTLTPSKKPTLSPSVTPTTIAPNRNPTASPTTISPSAAPSIHPSASPTTLAPSNTPTLSPTLIPTVDPSLRPSAAPTTLTPSNLPSISPSALPSVEPSLSPTALPTLTFSPSEVPTVEPSAEPTVAPSLSPTVSPTLVPSLEPSRAPTVGPSLTPSQLPTTVPTGGPSYQPSLQNAPIVQFTTSITLSGLTNNTLTEADEAAVVNATATSLGVSIDFVTYTGTTVVSSSRRLKGQTVLSETYTLIASTSVSVPLISYSTTNATAAYLMLSSAFESAVIGGDFVRYLSTAAAVSSSSESSVLASSPSVTVDSHSIDNEEVVNPPTFQPTKKPDSDSKAVIQGTILYIVVAVGGAVFLSVTLYFVTLCMRSRAKKTAEDGSSSTSAGVRSAPVDSNHQHIELPPMTLEQVYDGKHGNNMGF